MAIPSYYLRNSFFIDFSYQHKYLPDKCIFGNVDRETAITFGWERIVEAIEKEKKYRNVEKVLFSDYRLGSLYIFHSGDLEADVVMEERRTQFDVWRNKGGSFRTDTLIIADHEFQIGKMWIYTLLR